MHPFGWAALGAVLAAPVVMIATLLGVLLLQILFPTSSQLSSLARQGRLGPRKGVTSGDPAAAEGASCTSETLNTPACCLSAHPLLLGHGRRMLSFLSQLLPQILSE